MLDSESASQLLHSTKLNQTDSVLIVLAVHGQAPMTPANIRDAGVDLGISRIKKWNVPSLLSSSNYAIKYKEGWKISSPGLTYLSEKFGLQLHSSGHKPLAVDLRKYIEKVKSDDIKRFLLEAVQGYEENLFRSAVVLSWVGAVALLYDVVINSHLDDFNTEAQRRSGKWKNAKTAADLTKIKEHDFLEILVSISVIGKNVKQELQNNCLKLRNACGHPSSLKIGKNRVASHLEILILNVYQKFA